MKVIDLLNKIANGEDFKEKHIKYFDRIDQEYDICMICEANIIYKLDETSIELNDEVEILEEEKKIPEKLNLKLDDWTTPTQCDIELSLKKIDEIIDYLKSKGE